MKGTLLGAFGIALTVAGPAAGHVTVQPARAVFGEQTLEFTVPNEYFEPQNASRVDEVVVAAPDGARIGQLQAKPGWQAIRRGRTATWRGGAILYGQYDTFGVVVDVGEGAHKLVFQAVEHFEVPRGHIERYPVELSVGAPSSSSNGRGFAIGALTVALVAAGLAVVALFVGLARWLRAP